MKRSDINIGSKEDLIKIIEELWKDASSAYYNYNKIQDYGKLYHKYSEEMQQSPNYHHWEYKTAQEALFMALARLYDLSGGASLKWLLKECIKHVEEKSGLFPEYSAEYDLDGESYSIQYICKIRKNEECYFDNVQTEKKVEIKKEIARKKRFNLEHFITKTTEENFCKKVDDNAFVELELDIETCLVFFKYKLEKMNVQINNLKKLRNKIYAHKDPGTIFEKENILNQHPLDWESIKELMEYSVELLQFLLRAIRYYSIADVQLVYKNDLEDSLKLIHFALEYGVYDKF